jgi:hypothetical protein
LRFGGNRGYPEFRVNRLLFHNASPLPVVQLCAEPNGGRYLEAKKEADGRVVTKTSGSLSVAVLFAGLKERLQLLCGWEGEAVAVFFRRMARHARSSAAGRDLPERQIVAHERAPVLTPWA